MPDRVYARVEIDNVPLGVGEPPTHVELRILPAAPAWQLVTWFRRGDRSAVSQWLSQLGEPRPQTSLSRAGARRVITSATRLPVGLQALAETFVNPAVVLDPDGSAELILEGRRQDVRTLLEDWDLEPNTALVELRGLDAGTTVVTQKQRTVLARAWEHGYFEVPRSISTRELAGELGISHSTLSETLRRGIENLVGAWLAVAPSNAPRSGTEPPPEAGGEGGEGGGGVSRSFTHLS